LCIRDNIVWREVKTEDRTIQQAVIPKSSIPVVLLQLHNNMGHLGRDKTSSLVRQRVYWPRMQTDITSWIENCKRCTKSKQICHTAEIGNIRTSQPLELVCMDYLSLEPSKGGIQNIAVITDHFTKYTVAVPTCNQLAKTTAEVIFNHFILNHGILKKLHSDKCANFCNNIIKELYLILGIFKSRTTPYHPMGNGNTQQFNRTLQSMLGHCRTNRKLIGRVTYHL
jgi:transposase InsO family protein